MRWRARAVETLRAAQPKEILDVACGTADLSIAAIALGPDSITGVDIAEEMLRIGREKIAAKELDGTIRLRSGAAEHLGFPDTSFDAVMVAFGVRNFEDLPAGLREMYRVLRRGGRLVVLEFSRPRSFPFRTLYGAYFRFVLPRLGRAISGHPYAYRYLHDTVMEFPEGEAFQKKLSEAGFHNTKEERLTFGIATIYTATKG